MFAEKQDEMALRIKELCKSHQITMAEIANKIGIKPIALSQSLNGNPTLSRLQEVADILGVDVSELFESRDHQDAKKRIYGCLYINGKPVIVNNREDVERVLCETAK